MISKDKCVKTKAEKNTERINIRLTSSQAKFIKKNNLSNTKIFVEALKDLGYNGVE